MNTTVSVLFYIKRSKINVDGVCPIYTRVTIKTKRFEFSSGKFINPDKWSIDGAKVKGTSEEARSINSHLDYLKSKIYDAEKNLIKNDIPINSETLKNKLLGIEERQRTLIPIFKDHNNKIKELVGKEYTPAISFKYAFIF